MKAVVHEPKRASRMPLRRASLSVASLRAASRRSEDTARTVRMFVMASDVPATVCTPGLERHGAWCHRSWWR